MSENTPKKQRTKGIDSHEAVRRGLSFGPITKPTRHSFAAGILKATSNSPSPSPHRRSISAGDDTKIVQQSDFRVPKDRLPENKARSVDSSDDEDGDWSSGDESARGRSPRVKDGPNEDSATEAEAQESGSTKTSAEGEPMQKTTAKKFVVHPNTNFDKPVQKPTTRAMSPTASEEEELEATQRAQALPIFQSPPDHSVAHRAIQTLIRGDFRSVQEEAKEGQKRLRSYLAATDLSGEAAYALEWTIGTVMRDGDTLFAVYAVDEVVGTGKTGEPSHGEGSASKHDTAAMVENMTSATQKASLMPLPTPLTRKSLRPSSRKGSAATSTDSRALSVAQQERTHALQTLQETCLGLLRKTGLQCRIVIEVIHCKNPKYMITEAVCSSFSTPKSLLLTHR